jgi:hypothetical protein
MCEEFHKTQIMSAAKKILRKEMDRLKKALDKVFKPRKEAMPQLVLQPYRNPPHHGNLKKLRGTDLH